MNNFYADRIKSFTSISRGENEENDEFFFKKIKSSIIYETKIYLPKL